MKTDPWVFLLFVGALLSLLRFRRACRQRGYVEDVQEMRRLLIHARTQLVAEGKATSAASARLAEIEERFIDVQASIDALERKSREPTRAADPERPLAEQSDIA